MHAFGAPSIFPESEHGSGQHGAVLVFEPPEDATASYGDDLFTRLLARESVGSTFRRHADSPMDRVGEVLRREHDVELSHHLRRKTVPAPGEVADLLRLVAELHEATLDPERPAWLAYVIDGLAGGRFALYVKVHHSVADGVEILKLLHRMLSRDGTTELRTLWSQQFGDTAPPRQEPEPKPAQPADLSVGSLLRFGTKRMSGLAGRVPDSARVVGKALVDRDIAVPYRAPNSILNVPITTERTVLGRTWAMERITDIRRFARANTDEIVFALCSGALRQYLGERRELPSSSLIALVPLARHTDTKGIDKVGTLFCRLGTDQRYPEERLKTIVTSMANGRKIAETVGQASTVAASVVTMTPKMLAGVPGMSSVARPPFNLTITFVPGSREATYWDGARMRDLYPIPEVGDGQALGIAATFTEGALDVGLVACPAAVPDAERILQYMDDALVELEKIYH